MGKVYEVRRLKFSEREHLLTSFGLIRQRGKGEKTVLAKVEKFKTLRFRTTKQLKEIF